MASMVTVLQVYFLQLRRILNKPQDLIRSLASPQGPEPQPRTAPYPTSKAASGKQRNKKVYKEQTATTTNTKQMYGAY